MNKSNYYMLTFIASIFATTVSTGVVLESIFVPVYSQEQEETSSSSSVELTAKLIESTYRWVDSSGTVNPALDVTLGTDNELIVKSLENDTEEHELIIEGISSDGSSEEIIASDEIKSGSSDTINFNPTDVEDKNYQSLDYYCEYHPELMKGKMEIK